MVVKLSLILLSYKLKSPPSEAWPKGWNAEREGDTEVFSTEKASGNRATATQCMGDVQGLEGRGHKTLTG